MASVPVAISSGEPRGGDRAADGTETPIADLPDYDGYNTEPVHWAVTGSSGNVWMILDTTGQAPVKQYYVEVSPGGAVKTFPFTVPGDTCRYRSARHHPSSRPTAGCGAQTTRATPRPTGKLYR